MDDGVERIIDQAELHRVRRQAARVTVRSLITAALLTAVAVTLPVLGSEGP